MARIRYLYNQSAGLRAGVDLPESVIIEADAGSLSEDFRGLLSRASEIDGARNVSITRTTQPCVISHRSNGPYFVEIPGEPILLLDPAEVLVSLENTLATWMAAERARRKAEAEEQERTLREAEDKFLAAPVGAWSQEAYQGGPWKVCGPARIGYERPAESSRIHARWLEEEAEAARRTEASAQAREAEGKRIAEKVKAEREAEERRYGAKILILYTHIQAHGTDSQRARIARDRGKNLLGMLPVQEAEDSLREYLLQGINYPQYSKIRAGDVRSLCPDWSEYMSAGDKVEFSSDTPEALTADEFEALTKGEHQADEIRKLAAECAREANVSVEIKHHMGRWDCGNNDHEYHDLIRPSLRFVVEFGTPDGPSMTFSREFEI